MTMAFSTSDIFKVGIIIYVGIWLCLLLIYLRYTHAKELNVHTVARLYTYTALSRHWGWLILVVMFFIVAFIFPEVYIITQSRPEEIAENKDAWQEHDHHGLIICPFSEYNEYIYIDRRYVPFFYNGFFCKPASLYLSNESDSTLYLYSLTKLNGKFTTVDSEENFKEISPKTFQYLGHSISNYFSTPGESSYVSKELKDKEVTEWCIDFKSDAAQSIEEVRDKINGNYFTYPPYKIVIDSADIAKQTRQKILNQVLEQIEAYNGKDSV